MKQKKDFNRMTAESFGSEQGVRAYAKIGLTKEESDIIKQNFKGGKILDIGCGCGRTTVPLAKMGYKVIGIEIVSEMILYAKNKFPRIKFKQMNATALEFPNESFDNILFSYCGLDYIYPESMRLKALKEIFRVPKPGGYFVFSSHNSLSLPNYFKNFKRIKTALFNLPRMTYSRYWLEKMSFGPCNTHYSSPFKQLDDAKKAGFSKVWLYGGRTIKNLFFNTRPYFIAIK